MTSFFYNRTDKRLAVQYACCIQVQRRQTTVQAQHLNLTTKFSTTTIKLSIAIETVKAFVFDETKNESISVVETHTGYNVICFGFVYVSAYDKLKS